MLSYSSPDDQKPKTFEAKFVEKTMMATDRIPMLFFFLLIHFQFSQAALHFSTSFPISEILSSSRANVSLSHMLQDVVEVISASENWNVEDVRISEVHTGEARYGVAQFYEFSVELDDNHFVPISFSDNFGSWRKFRKSKSDFYSLVNEANSLAVMDTLEIKGPVELWVDHPHRFSLSLPNNISHVGLDRILAVEGITLQLRNASEVYLRYSSSYDLSVLFEELEYSAYGPYMSSSSKLIQPVEVHTRGTASVAAHVTGIPRMPVDTSPISDDAILLHPPADLDNLNLSSAYQCRNKRWCPSESDPLSMRLSMGHKIWRSLIGTGRLPQYLSILSVSFYAHRKAVAAVKFCIVLERDLGIIEQRDWISYGGEPLWNLLSNSPNKRNLVRAIEWVRFEVAAKVEADLRLNPISFQKTTRATIYRQDTNSSNDSFTTCYNSPFDHSLGLLL